MGVLFLHLFFSLNGRINRAQYWLGCTLVLLALALTLLAPMSLVERLAVDGDRPDPALLAGALTSSLLMLPMSLVVSWCSFALQVKRFHDRGRTGWFTLLPFAPLLAMLLLFVGAMSGGEAKIGPFMMMAPFMLMLWGVNLWFLIELGFLPGKAGPNRYGDAPGGGVGGSPAGDGAPGPAEKWVGGAQAAMDRAILGKGAPASAQPVSPPARPAPAAPRPEPAPAFGRRAPAPSR